MNIIKRTIKAKSKVTIYFDKNGEVIEAVGNIGWTRAGRGAFALNRLKVNPTFGYKLRRFFRRLPDIINEMIEDARVIATTPAPSAVCADELPLIGLEECSRNE